jgi:hypothetical protein
MTEDLQRFENMLAYCPRHFKESLNLRKWLYKHISMRGKLRLLILMVFCIIPCFGQSGIINSSRYINWANAGTPGGVLPDSGWTQCGSTIGSYSGAPTTINNALSSCTANHYVLLGSGTFTLTAAIVFPENLTGHIELRGAGATSTQLNFSGYTLCPNGTTGLICISSSDGTYPGGPTTTVNWTSGYAQGATQIILSSVAGITLNQTMLVLNQCDTGFSGAACTTGAATDNGGYFVCALAYTGTTGCSADGADGSTWRANAWQMEIVEVTAINAGGCGSTCVTISQPLEHPNWASGQSPQAVLIQALPQDGVINLALDAATAGNGLGEAIGIQNCFQCFVSGVRIANMYSFGIYGLGVSHTLIQNNYLFKSINQPDSYGIRLSWAGDDLTQNNIIQQWKNSFSNDGPASGEVLAYNFSVDQIVSDPSDQLWGAWWTHSTGDDFMLREGNIGNQAQDDNVHGSHLNPTLFRNFLTGWETCKNSTTGGGNCGAQSVKDETSVALVQSSNVRYVNDVANVMGTAGATTTYITSVPFAGYAVYNLGGGTTTNGRPTDPLTKSTGLFWGNYDTVTSSVRWCGNSSDTGWTTVCGSVSEVPTGAPTYPNSIPTLGDRSAGMGPLPASFYLSSRPSWWSPSIPYPAIGPDITLGNIGQCTGTLNTTNQAGLPATAGSQCGSGVLGFAWAGHVNANPAMSAYLAAGGLPDGTGPELTINLSYPGTPAPVACFSPTSLSFGNQNINTTSAGQSFTLTNCGNATLTIGGIALVTGTQFSQSNTCGASLAANASCTITAKFAPTATGAQSDSVSFTDNASGSPQLVSLTGTGINPTGIVQLNYTNCASQTFSTTVCTIPSGQQGGATIFGWLSNNDSGSQTVTSVTDNVGNTYSHVAGSNSVNTAFGTNADIWWAQNVTAGATQLTITVSPAASGNGAIAQVSNINAVDQVCIASNQPASGTPAGCPVTTTHNAEYIFSISVLQAGATAVNSPFILNSNQSGNCIAYYAPSTTGAYNSTCTAPGTPGTFNNSTASFYQASATPVATITPTTLAFGNQTINTPSTAQVVTLKNTGSATLTISSIAFVSGTQYSQTNNCGTSLAAGLSCTVNVTFKPTSLGLKTDSLTFTDNASNSPQSVTLSGTGVSAPSPGVGLSPTTLSFANQVINTSSSSQVITLTNTGNTNLAITSIGMATGTQFSQTNNCPSSVAAAGTCTINVTFKPTSVGAKSDSVTIVDNASGSPHTAGVSGVGVASGSNVSPASLAFGNQSTSTTSPAQIVTISNGGTSNLSISAVTLTTGTQYADVTNCVTASPISPNSSCTISVTFTPTSTGLKSDTVNITSNYSGSPQTVALSGTGVTGPVPGVTLNPTSLNFGLQLLSPSAATQVITLTNSGNASLTVTAVAMTTGTQFTVSSTNCISGSPIAANGTCTITIQFSPTTVGAATDAVNITDNAASSPQSATVMGTGVSAGQGLPTVLNMTVTAH